MTFTIAIPEWLRLSTGSHRPDAAGVCELCVEEVLAVLVDQGVTDAPNCVHPILRDLSIRANDSERDTAKRTALMPDGIRSRGTSECDEAVTTGLAVFVCRYVALHMPEDTHESVLTALRAAANCLDAPSEATRAEAAEAARAAWAAWAAWAAAEAAWDAEAAAEAARAAWAAEAAEAAAEAAWDAEAAAEAAWDAEAAAEAAGAAGAAGAAFYADLLAALLDEYDRLTGRTPDQYRIPTVEEWARVARVLGVPEADLAAAANVYRDERS